MVKSSAQLPPEQKAREVIDAALQAAGWVVQDWNDVNLSAGRGVAVREFRLKAGFGYADYILFVDGEACGVIEAKKVGTTLRGVELQADNYRKGLPDDVPARVRPLPFLYQSTGIETLFTNRLDPAPRSRDVFHFHKPETFAAWLAAEPLYVQAKKGARAPKASELPATLRARLREMPELETRGLWKVQAQAVRNLETSLADNRPRALVQMATGSGKTFTAVTSAYRLIKFGGAERILFLVDRANLGRQALREFQQYTTPDDGRKFTELYNVQHLTSNRLDPVAKVVITTIQRLYSMLQGTDLDPADEEASQFGDDAPLVKEPVPVAYSPAIPVEFFDFIFIDECHRSIYSLWSQVLDYFDAFHVGLTATPSKQSYGFFHGNRVMQYSQEQAVADGVNVDFDVYRIRTRITEKGNTIEAGAYDLVQKRDRVTRAKRWEKLDDDLKYDPTALDDKVVARDQIRTLVRTFKERLYTEIFPGRTDVPKTLIYAKDDAHAEDIVEIVREEFGRGNDFCWKITYKTTGAKTDDLIASFRNSYNPRIAVTVDMIATGTDIKPLEVVMFLRAVRSRNFFEQMKGRGVRVIGADDYRSVTQDPKAVAKDHFILHAIEATDVGTNRTAPRRERCERRPPILAP